MSDIVPTTEEELVGLLNSELQNTLGGGSETSGSDSELTQAWEDALDYYFGKPRGDEIDGRSKVISMDVADMVEQTVAQVVPALTTDNLGEFSAYNAAEATQAKAESAAVNWAILTQNNGLVEFIAAVKDGLLQRNGIIEIDIDEHIEISEESFENVPLSALSQLEEMPNIELTGADTVEEGMFTEEGQILVEPTYNIELKKQNKVKQLIVEAVAPDEFRVNGDHNSIFLHNARFVCRTKFPTRSELIQQGYDPAIIDDLPATTTRTDIDARARSRDEQENELEAAQKAGERIQIEKCIYLVDMDGDGIAERRRIIKAGSKILENEIFPVVPFAAWTPFLLPHRFYGLSMFDKIKQTQDVKTAFLRKTLDNAESIINQRVTVVANQVNMDDVLSSRPNGVVRAKRTDAVSPWPVQSLGDTGFKMLGYMDKTRKEAGGAQLDLGTSENMPVQGQTAHGMERWMSSQEQLGYLMTNMCANTLIKETYRISHIMLRTFMPEELTYENDGQMVSTNPMMWPPRPKVKINVQLSMAERQRKYMILTDEIAQQKEDMASGKSGVTASLQTLYSARLDRAKIAGIENPERYWIDPTSQESQQAAQQNQQGAMAQQQHDDAQNDKLLQTQLQISQLQEQSDKMKAQLDYAIKVNEQLRKWTDMELEYNTDIPNEGAPR